MELPSLNFCCGIGELGNFDGEPIYPLDDDKEWPDWWDGPSLGDKSLELDRVVEQIKKIINGDSFKVIIATTPDTEHWGIIHLALMLCDFHEITSTPSLSGGRYDNILWVWKKL